MTDSSSFVICLFKASIAVRVPNLTCLLGHDFWHTAPIPRLHVPSIRMSDGPNGVRGTRFFNGAPAACLPCGTGLGATWDVDLVREAGTLLGKEAKAKGVAIWLGPTINIPSTWKRMTQRMNG